MENTFLSRVQEANPDLEMKYQGRQGSSVKIVNSYVNIKIENAQPWVEFSYLNITSAYGHVLQTVQNTPRSLRPSRSMCLIGPEDSMKTIVSHWCKKRIDEGLKHAAAVIQKDLGQPQIEPSFRVESINVGKNQSFTQGIPKEDQDRPGSYVSPDSFVLGCVEIQKGPIYMPLEIKPSSLWRSSMLRNKATDAEVALQPLRQLGTYCKHCDTRIGVIITPEEVVAVRYYDIGRWEVGCHYMPVPWSNSGDRMTVNLAIWACAMLSLNDKHHHIVPRKYLFPEVNAWQEIPSRGCYQHIYSGRLVSELPIGAVVVTNTNALAEVPERVVVSVGSTEKDILRGQRRIAAQQRAQRLNSSVNSDDTYKRKSDTTDLRPKKMARTGSRSTKK